MTDQSRWTMRCPDARELIDGWDDTDLWIESRPGPIPAGLSRCPPCCSRTATAWVTRIGLHETIVHAGCETAARMTAWRRFHHQGNAYGEYRTRRDWKDRPKQTAQVTARPATPDDIIRFDRMVQEQEAGVTGPLAERMTLPEGLIADQAMAGKTGTRETARCLCRWEPGTHRLIEGSDPACPVHVLDRSAES